MCLSWFFLFHWAYQNMHNLTILKSLTSRNQFIIVFNSMTKNTHLHVHLAFSMLYFLCLCLKIAHIKSFYFSLLHSNSYWTFQTAISYKKNAYGSSRHTFFDCYWSVTELQWILWSHFFLISISSEIIKMLCEKIRKCKTCKIIII